jgi:hypothetical protein
MVRHKTFDGGGADGEAGEDGDEGGERDDGGDDGVGVVVASVCVSRSASRSASPPLEQHTTRTTHDTHHISLRQQ